MNSIELIIKGKPIAQPRHSPGKNKNVYIPKEHPIHAYKELIKLTLISSKHFRFIESGIPVALGVKMYFKVADKPVEPHNENDYHIYTPDIDNVVKAVKDALSGNAFEDDRQVCKYLEVGKFWTHGEARTEIIIEEIEE